MPVSANSVYGQDVSISANVALDLTKSSRIGTFTNQSLVGKVPDSAQQEAIVIQKTEADGQLVHMKRSPNTRNGWVANPIYKDAKPIFPKAVTAGTSYEDSGTVVRGFFADDEGIFAMTLGDDGATWTVDAQPLLTTQGNTQIELQCTHMLGDESPGVLVAYGKIDDQTFFVAAPDAEKGLQAKQFTLDRPLTEGYYKVAATQEEGTPVWYMAMIDGGAAYGYTGNMSSGASTTGLIDLGTAKADNVVMSHLIGGNAVFLISDENGAIYTCDTSGPITVDAIAPVQVPDNARVIASTTQVYSGESEVYQGQFQVLIVDSNQRMHLLRQIVQDSAMDSGYNSWTSHHYPNWTALLTLSEAVFDVQGEVFGSASTTVFQTTATGSLACFSKPTMTGRWRTHYVATDTRTTVTTRVFRTEFLLTDENGTPQASQQVVLSTGNSDVVVDVEANGNVYAVGNAAEDASLGATLQTGVDGRITVTLLNPSGISAPDLSLHVPDQHGALGDAAVTANAAAPIQYYISGQGNLYKDQQKATFDAGGNTLRSAGLPFKTGGEAAAGDAAAAMQAGAKLGTGQAAQNQRFTPPSAAARAAHGYESSFFGDLFGDAEHFLGDVWHSIEHGFSELAQVVVDAEHKLVQFTLTIAGKVVDGFKAVVHAVEDAAKFVASVVNAIVEDIEKFYEWLKALFSFQDIWDTKVALETGITALVDRFEQIVAGLKNKDSAFFDNLKKAVDKDLQSLIDDLEGNASVNYFGNMNGMQTPNTDQPIGSSNATQTDVTNNPHHNFAQAKVTSAGPNGPTPGSFDASGVLKAIQDLSDALDKAEGDVNTALQNMYDTFEKGASSSSSTPSVADAFKVGLASLLELLKGLADAMIDFTEGVVSAILDLSNALLQFFVDLINKPLDVPDFIEDLWTWITSFVDTRGHDTLSFNGLACLVLAFPTTIIFKILTGDADAAPFPGGDMSNPYHTTTALSLGAAGGGQDISTDDTYEMFAGLIMMVSFFPNALVDETLEKDSPQTRFFSTVALTCTLAGFAITTYRKGINYFTDDEDGQLEVFLKGALIASVGGALGAAVWNKVDNTTQSRVIRVAGYANAGYCVLRLFRTLFQWKSESTLTIASNVVFSVCGFITFFLKLNTDAYYKSLQRRETVLVLDVIQYVGGGAMSVLGGLTHSTSSSS